MKNFTKAFRQQFSLYLGLFGMILVSSCSSSNTQHFSFSPAPPAYQKQKVAEAPAIAETKTEDNNLTASTAAAPVILPEVAKLTADKAPQIVQASLPTLQKDEVKTKAKLTLAQKVALKKLQKQATKLERKVKETKDITAGPVSNRNAIALMLIGLVAVLIGGLLGIGVFYTLGTLVILIGLVLLVLNYL